MKNYLPTVRTPINNPLVHKLLEKNHKEHDIFFEHGKHNHFSHILLSDYALGADDARLSTEWRNEETMLEPFPKSLEDVKITEENWKEFIAHEGYYPAYFKFFSEQIKSFGRIETMKKFMLDSSLLPSVFGGLLHPLIHIGFGIEFESDILTAEGLAMACCSKPILKDFSFVEERESGKVSLPEIFDMIRKDNSIGPVIRWDEPNKSEVIQKLSNQVRRYTQMFRIQEEGRAMVEALKDVYLSALHIFGASPFHPKAEGSNVDYRNLRPDFFLLHVLTSALALRILIPHLDISQAKMMLQSHVAAQIIFFIRAGRPPLNLVALERFPTSHVSHNWTKLVNLVVRSKDLHLAKVVRACLFGWRLWNEKQEGGEISGLFDREELSHVDTQTSWFRTCAIAVDHKELQSHTWERHGPGFIDSWTTTPAGQ
jgi:hypothetical protein